VGTKDQGKGTNLLIYPSALLAPGRLGKIARSLQSSHAFDETVIVGILSDGAPAQESVAERVTLTRIPGASLRSFLGGIRIMAFWPFRVYRAFRKTNLAAVAAQNVYVLPLAYHLSRRTHAVLAYNAHELETETIGARGVKQRIARFIERRYIRHADVVSVVNQSIADWYTEHYAGVRPVVLTNTPIDDGRSVDVRNQLRIPDDELLYIHVGFLMEGRNIPLLLKEFASRPTTHLAFLGDGRLREEVEQAAQAHDNIHLLPTVPPDSVVSVVRGADIGLCLIEHVSLSDRLSTPNKLMESLVAGIPALCSDLVEARRLLGPELSKTWILDSPEQQLPAALDSIGPGEITAFAARWSGVPSWDEQATVLIDAYRAALDSRDRDAVNAVDQA
jgi:glycosyltransferase involved in cell wall biosynthesis